MKNEQPEPLPPCSCDLCVALTAPSDLIAAELRRPEQSAPRDEQEATTDDGGQMSLDTPSHVKRTGDHVRTQ